MSDTNIRTAVIASVVLLAAGCGTEEVTEKGVRPVQVFEVSAPPDHYERVFSGQLEASEGTGIGFQVSGRIETLVAKVGERKEADTLIARLDNSDYLNQLDDATAQRAQARQDLVRTQRLFEAGNASQSQLDNATTRNTSAEAAFQLAKKRVNDCVLKMPYSGLIGAVLAEVEQLVNAGQNIVTIQGEEGLEFELGVPADLVGEIRQEMQALIEIGGREDLIFTGQVTEISPQVARNTTYPVILSIQDVDDRIRAGMDGVARLQFPVNHETVVLIPFQCVVSQAGTEPFVWLADRAEGGSATLRRQTVEVDVLEQDGMIRILSGLSPGDWVVSRGVHRVEDGLTVRPEKE